MLAVENSEIGATVIALSIPGLKPLFGTLFDKLVASYPRSHGNSTPAGLSGTGIYGMGTRKGSRAFGSALASNPYTRAASETSVKVGPAQDSDDELLNPPQSAFRGREKNSDDSGVRDNGVRVTTTTTVDRTAIQLQDLSHAHYKL
jgi:hypothetical protein